MVQKRDLPWAYASLASLRRLEGAGLSRLVLVNDACNGEVRARLEETGDATVIVAGRNLGVAGGRNRLVREAAARGAEYVLSIDDDILLPPDFVEIVWREHERLREAGGAPGILTPATLDFHALRSVLFSDDDLGRLDEGASVETPLTAGVVEKLKAPGAFAASGIYHMGIRDWRGNYLFADSTADAAIQKFYGITRSAFQGRRSNLKAAPESIGAILDRGDPIEIDTAPGGICFYSTELFERVGGVDEAFNPFGYEDADFALRAKREGYRNYCAPRAVAIHDIAARLRSRPLAVFQAGQGKMIGVFARRHLAGGQAAAAFLAFSRRVMQPIGAAEGMRRMRRRRRVSLRTPELLSGLAAYLGAALLFVLPEDSPKKPPSVQGCLERLRSFASSLFPEAAGFRLTVAGGRVRVIGADAGEPVFEAGVEAGGGGTLISIDRLHVWAPRDLAPPLIRALSGELNPELALSFRIVIGAKGAFRVEKLLLEVPEGLNVKAMASGVRPPKPENSVAPLHFEHLRLCMKDEGGLARVLRLLAEVEKRSVASFVNRLEAACRRDEFRLLFTWLRGTTTELELVADGTLDGTPGLLRLNLAFEPFDGLLSEFGVGYLSTGESWACANGGAAGSPEIARGVMKLLPDVVKRLASEDPKVAPYPDSYDPGPRTRLFRKLRYIAASRGVPLTANEFRILRRKDSGKGRRAFIIGNGPSLNLLDLTKLKNELTFGVNAIYLNHEKMGFLPTHYIVEDVFVAEDRAAEINALKGPTKWFGNYLRYCLSGGADVCWMNVACDYRNYADFPHFSNNAARIVWVGGTVSYVALQLAYYMGVDTVYLVGFDHSYSVPTDAEVKGRAITSQSDDPNHFHPDYFGKGYRWHDPLVSRMEAAYKKARRAYEAAGRKIINATAGGRLEVFARVDYDSLF